MDREIKMSSFNLHPDHSSPITLLLRVMAVWRTGVHPRLALNSSLCWEVIISAIARCEIVISATDFEFWEGLCPYIETGGWYVLGLIPGIPPLYCNDSGWSLSLLLHYVVYPCQCSLLLPLYPTIFYHKAGGHMLLSLTLASATVVYFTPTSVLPFSTSLPHHPSFTLEVPRCMLARGLKWDKFEVY